MARQRLTPRCVECLPSPGPVTRRALGFWGLRISACLPDGALSLCLCLCDVQVQALLDNRELTSQDDEAEVPDLLAHWQRHSVE